MLKNHLVNQIGSLDFSVMECLFGAGDIAGLAEESKTMINLLMEAGKANCTVSCGDGSPCSGTVGE